MAVGHKRVFLDTSFLGAMMKDSDPAHESANQYFRYWVEHKTIMIISAIVLSEIKVFSDKIPSLILDHTVVMPFNGEAAIYSALVWRARVGERLDGQPKVYFKDDMKIIGHALQNECDAIAHKDTKSMHRYIIDAVAAKVGKKPVRSLVVDSEFDESLAALGDDAVVQPKLPGFIG